LDTPFDDDHELTPLELLQEGSPNQEEGLIAEQEKRVLEAGVLDAMKHLNDKEAFVIKNRVMAESPLTLREIGIISNFRGTGEAD